MTRAYTASAPAMPGAACRPMPDAAEPPPPASAASVALATAAFAQFKAQCFWSADPNLQINASHIDWVIAGLRENGGHEGYRLAAELQRCR